MHYRKLRDGLAVSGVSFGAGPVPALFTGNDRAAQRECVERALTAGINWFDTAAGYGAGESERNLGRTLAEVQAGEDVYVASKVRLVPEQLADMPAAIRASVLESLRRLGRERLDLLQLHNGITIRRDDQPSSIAPQDVLGSGGVLETFVRLQSEGLIVRIGLTGLGHGPALLEVLESHPFDAMQAPYNLLDARDDAPPLAQQLDIDRAALVRECADRSVAVFAIRVMAGGALAGRAPSEHTRRTRYFPLDKYERDRARAASIQEQLPSGTTLPEAACRFVLAAPQVTSALIGFGSVEEVEAAVRWEAAGPPPIDLLSVLRNVSDLHRISGLRRADALPVAEHTL